ncbi:hypothetical protein [Anabaena azotica]|uniref:Uncharacterized protein n=1 Tax=Anabaena azotica FACHB-119 TaxID=947527 RepID=A0ABR8D0V7_9NOST|nr:hypothetical protein [Anabaena azotica]MBD2499865.1 hypothetical protein [Anabaena azotica FACHB-119]
MNILKFKNGYVGNNRLVYCGRPKKDEYYVGQLLIGLGNPYSWKRNKKAKFQVKNLDESLTKYRKFTWKLICCYRDRKLDELQPWEFRYWQLMNLLAIAIMNNEIDGLVCWCTEIQDYVPIKGQEVCHTQILYAACLYMIDKELVCISELINQVNLQNLW